jgi:uncharacterized protein (DUF2236 family)
MLDLVRRRVTAATTDPFGHADYPLANSLDHAPDPGLFGPGSMSWEVLGDTAAFVGGVRGLLIQAAHPEVVAGVHDHSRYREDPLGRLSRTSAYVTATTYGAMPEVEAAVRFVRRAHRPVAGMSHRGRPYSAGDPGMAAWVHNALTDSFLRAFQVYGSRRLSEDEADRFVAEQTRVGALLDADPMPTTARELAAWVAGHPEVGPSPGLTEAVGFLRDPPLRPAQRAGYAALFTAAVAILPVRIRDTLGLGPAPGGEAIGRATVAGLRWALGSSPSWHLALVRTGAPVPEDRFIQPLPADLSNGPRG